MDKGKQSLYERLQSIERLPLYVTFLIVVMIPLVVPLNLPVAIGPHAIALYNKIESLKPGDVVLFDFSYGWSFAPIHHGAHVAIWRHLFSRPGIKVIMVEFFAADSVLSYEYALKVVNPSVNYPDKKYGEDWVWLGWVTGMEAAVAAFADDIWKTVPTDAKGTPMTQYPSLYNAVKNCGDFDLVIEGGGHGGVNGVVTGGYLKYIGMKYHVPMAYNMDPATMAEFFPYYPDVIFSLINGNRGGAEYEKLIKRPGSAIMMMDATSTTHVYSIALIALANIGFLLERQRVRAKRKSV